MRKIVLVAAICTRLLLAGDGSILSRLPTDPLPVVSTVSANGDNAGTRSEPVSKGELIFQNKEHLRGPLGLVMERNGNLIVTNGDVVNGNPNQPSEMVEFTRWGHFVTQYSVDLGGQEGAFGLALEEGREEDGVWLPSMTL
jgi:hypothetical protein